MCFFFFKDREFNINYTRHPTGCGLRVANEVNILWQQGTAASRPPRFQAGRSARCLAMKTEHAPTTEFI